MSDLNPSLPPAAEASMSNALSINSGFSFGIPKLTSTNYLPWKRQITILLKLKGLEKAIRDRNVDEMTDMQAVMLLLSLMDESHRLQVQSEVKAIDIIENLDRQYADKSAASKHRMISKFFKYQKDATHTINMHASKMREMRSALASLNEVVSEEVFQVALIDSLPPEFGDVMKVWETLHSEMKTTEFLMNYLQNREREIEKNPSISALPMKMNKTDFSKLSIAEKKKITNCSICKKRGHWAKECPDKKPEQQSSNEKKIVTDIAFVVSTEKREMKDKWISDGGATSHMANNLKFFSRIKLYNSPTTARVGNGQAALILGIGEVKIQAKVGNNILVQTLTDVAFVPSLFTNLISVGKALKKGVTTSYELPNRCIMRIKDRTVAIGHLAEDELFVMQIEAIENKETAAIVDNGQSLKQWHEAMGHADLNRCRAALKSDNINVDTSCSGNCGGCPGGKATHQPHPSSSEAKNEEPGYKVHVDLGHLTLNKDSKFHFYMLAKDEATEFTFIYFLESKSQVALALSRLLIDIETGCGRCAKVIHSDNGSEFKNTAVELLFLRNNVKQTFSAPYCPQQNGLIEREIRTIKGMARSMLVEAGLDDRFIPDALKTACYIKNRLPTKELGVSPYERFVGRKPKVGHLKKFGTQVQVLRSNEYLTAFEPRTRNGFLVGYTDRMNTFYIFVPSLGRTIVTSDVVFRPHRNESLVDEKLVPPSAARDAIVNLNIEKSAHSRGEPSMDSEIMMSSTPIGPREDNNTKKYIALDELDNFFEEFRMRGLAQLLNESGRSGPNLTIDQSDEESPPDAPPRSSSLLLTVENTESDNDLTSMTYHEAITGSNGREWQSAIKKELEALEETRTYVIADIPSDAKLLTTKWVFVKKRNKDGQIERFKARLVVRGFEQKYGIDFLETYAPVARIETVRVMLSLATIMEAHIIQFDVATAFLHGNIDEHVYVKIPDGMKKYNGKCLKLQKALYGLKQAPRAWNKTFNMTMQKFDMYQTQSDPSLYVNKDGNLFLLLYVDDALIIGREMQCEKLFAQIEQAFKIKRLPGECFLGLEITRADKTIKLSQKRYIRETIDKFNMSQAKGVFTPCIDFKTLHDTNAEKTTAPYRQAIGCLMYVANCTRPDVLYTVNFLSRFNNCPTINHWQCVKQIMRYLIATIDYEIIYSGENIISAYSDASYNSVHDEKHSTSGVLLNMAGGPIIFSSRKQSAIAQSSTEAEYIAANESVKELVWLTQLLRELNHSHPRPVLFLDNQSTIKQIENNEVRRRSKHVDLKYHYVRHMHAEKVFVIKYIESAQQLADIMTKPMGGKKLQDLCQLAGLTSKSKVGGAICLLVILSSFGSCSGAGFRARDPLYWVPSEDRFIMTGITDQQIIFEPMSPCSIAFNNTESEQDVKKTLYRNLIAECEKSFKNEYMSAINEYATCLHTHTPEQRRGRKKRFIEPLTIFAIVTAVIYVVSWIGTTLYSYFDDDSSYNRLNRQDEVNREQEAKDKRLQDEDQIIKNRLAQLEDNALKAADIRAWTLNITDNINSRVHSNRVAIDQMAQLSGPVSWAAAQLHSAMETEISEIRRMAAECTKTQRVATKEMTSAFRVEFLKAILPEHTHIQSIRWVNNKAIKTQILIQEMSQDTKIFEIKSMPHIDNYKAGGSWLKYNGPPFVLYNVTNDCTKGLWDTSLQRVAETCTESNTVDPALQQWVPAPEDEIEFLSRPLVIQGPTTSSIQCWGHNITMGLKTFPCPYYPFELPITTQFRLDNMTHNVKVETMRSSDPHRFISAPHIDVPGTDADYVRETNAIKYAHEVNRRLKEKQTVGYSAFENNEKNENLLSGGLNLLGIIFLVLIIFKLVKLGLKRHRGQPGQRQAASGAQIGGLTINNVVPDQRRPSDRSTPVYAPCPPPPPLRYPLIHNYDVPNSRAGPTYIKLPFLPNPFGHTGSPTNSFRDGSLPSAP